MRRNFAIIYNEYARQLLKAEKVDVGEWHAQKVKGVPQLVTREVRNAQFTYRVPHTIATLQEDVDPNMPFAEAQFRDRVSGEPLNPPPSADLWPYAQQNHKQHLEAAGGVFSHSYPERMWPKDAGDLPVAGEYPHEGIRYPYGDLNDVVKMLSNSPMTRQAYLPIWFPEDTGNQGVRLPCTLGYHFMLRRNALHITYFIRAVDFVRHFRDDVYMAARLVQWVLCELRKTGAEVWNAAAPGDLTMHMISLHCMLGDEDKLRRDLAPVKTKPGRAVR